MAVSTVNTAQFPDFRALERIKNGNRTEKSDGKLMPKRPQDINSDDCLVSQCSNIQLSKVDTM